MKSGYRVASAVLSLVLAGSVLGCAARQSETAPKPAGTSTAERAVDYAKLLTVEDAARISGYPDVSEEDLGIRQGDSKYLVIYGSPEAREFLWLRAGKASMFDEQRKVTDGAEKDTSVKGLEAYTWSGENIDSGVALRKDGTTYLISSKWNAKTGTLQPLLTQDQLMQAAETVAGRLP